LGGEIQERESQKVGNKEEKIPNKMHPDPGVYPTCAKNRAACPPNERKRRLPRGVFGQFKGPSSREIQNNGGRRYDK